jgi:isobutyryl-CoA mutase
MSAAAPETVTPTRDPASAAGVRPLRVVTAASLFDGHDAAINIMRRLIQEQGAEVIHLGHNRGVQEIVRAAIQEDADAIAVSSYQGGHVEFFEYMVDLLAAQGASHVRVFGGGGGVIVPDEVRRLHAHGVTRIYSPEDGRRLGLDGMIRDLVETAAKARRPAAPATPTGPDDHLALGRALTALEAGLSMPAAPARAAARVPVLGITGPGGAGKSSLTDELLLRCLADFPDLRIAVLAVDPTRRRTGGALLGDRIRMNALASPRIYMRSLATRRAHLALSAQVEPMLKLLCGVGFGLVVLETAGIGQGDSEVADLADFSVYVMTPEYGAPSQLEKIEMLDLADAVALNKFEKRGAEDALRDVRKQWRRNHRAFDAGDEAVPVYPTIASRFADPGVDWLYVDLTRRLVEKLGLDPAAWATRLEAAPRLPVAQPLIPAARVRYLAEIAEQGRALTAQVEAQAGAARRAQHLYEALRALEDPALPAPLAPYPADAPSADAATARLRGAYSEALAALDPATRVALQEWPARRAAVEAPEYEYAVRGRPVRGANYVRSISGLDIPKIAPPRTQDWGELTRFLGQENLPGAYPYTAGVYPYRRGEELPTRMFAGEGTPERTNRRFHYLARGQGLARLSTAFDSVTLYGADPDPRPDIYGKVGNSGVSVCCLDDMKKLYAGFDLADPRTSVSMTINGPAPMILAMFLSAAVDQQVEKHLRASGRWEETERALDARFAGRERPRYEGALPPGSDGLGLGLLGVSGDEVVDAETYARIREDTLSAVRGTVQADILKEDQAQNTCIFSTEFALRMMGDIQDWFIAHRVRNFYSVSISGYHIAEAGANPITQLAFTLANGFTIVEYYLARGMQVDEFAPNLSFFFSNGMDAEYAVLGRVARRIWARAMRERYGAGPRAQMLKYHIQTSGRSLHAQEIQFNDIRTTLQALYALYDNCNSLHTNAYDEAITTPTQESVRRAVAIQLVIAKELGLNQNENPLQGAFIVERLTDLVEEAVYREFERLSERGGVLGAMETMYQRAKIQDESLHYEQKKHDGSLPIVGVNTFLPPEGLGEEAAYSGELIRSTEAEKRAQLAAVRSFQDAHRHEAPAALARLQQAARRGENTFDALMDAVRCATLGQISDTLYAVGGKYRRSV